jgi:hypothetical protein
MSTNPPAVPSSALPFDLLRATVRRLKPGWRFAAENFQYLEGGYANANYRFSYQGEHFVLRIPVQATRQIQTEDPQADSSTDGLVTEIRFRSLAKQHGALAIAPLVAADVTHGQMITGFVDGPLLAEQPPVAEKAIAYLRHLHEQLVNIPRTDHYNLNQLISRWLPEPPVWLGAYLGEGADLQLLAQGPLQCCHNDLNPWNVIISSEQPQGWTTLDWETAMLAHPVFDAVTLHQGLAAATTDGTNGVALDRATPNWPSLAEFCAKTLTKPVSPEVLQAALRTYWLREYAWAVAQLRQGNHNPAIAAQQRSAQQQLQMHL